MRFSNVCGYIFLVLAATCLAVDAHKILGIFHFPSQSHQILGSALLKELAKRGHQVTMVSPFPEKHPIANYTNIELTGLLEMKEELSIFFNEASTLDKISVVVKTVPQALRYIVNHPNLKKLMDSGQKFDAIILFWPIGEPLLGVADKLGAPVIAFSPIGGNIFTNMHSRNPSPFSYVPNTLLGFSDKMTFFQRVTNTLFSIFFNVFYSAVVLPSFEQIHKEAFPDGRPLQELIDEVNLYLINAHHSTETHRPYLPNMITIGGYHLQEDQELPEDLKKYLDGAKEGVVYVSFGSNIKSSMFTQTQKEALLNTLAKQKVKVLWKFEEEIPNKPKNIRTEKWMPQKSVLAHHNVKAFISHGGMGGISEAIYYGVPFVGIPFFGDQGYNVQDAVDKGYAVRVESKELDEESLSKAVHEILNNSSYRETIQKRSSLYRDQPINPVDKAIFWIDHVIKHKGAKHLRPAGSDLPFYQYYLLDVIAFLGSLATLLIGLTYFITKKTIGFICSKFCRKSSAKSINKKNKKKSQ